MPSKRGHSKSRRGCGQCKGRRIKCDEIAPRCGQCEKRGLSCDYRELKDVPAHIELLTPANFHTPRRQASPGHATKKCTDPQHFSTDDLLLIHHFTLYTSRTVGTLDEEDYHFIWQHRVPELASRHPFLMHAVLSHAASHIATLDPGHTFQAARAHYSKALGLFTTSVDAVNSDRADAIYCFCVLIMLITFNLEARHALYDESNAFATGIVHSFGVIRSAAELLQPLLDGLRQREIGRLVRHIVTDEPHPIANEARSSLDRLDSILLSEQCSFAVGVWETLNDAANRLRNFFTLVQPRPATWALILQWPISLSLEYLALLQQNSYPALAIFTLWCVPMYNAPRRWDVGDWPKRVVLEIQQLLAGTIWEDAIQWPISEILS